MQTDFNFNDTNETVSDSIEDGKNKSREETDNFAVDIKSKERNKKTLDEEMSKLEFYEVKTPDFLSVITSTNIKRLRKRLNLSEKNFSDLLGVTVETVDAWENGSVVPRSTTLRLLYLLIKEPKLALCLFELKRKSNNANW